MKKYSVNNGNKPDDVDDTGLVKYLTEHKGRVVISVNEKFDPSTSLSALGSHFAEKARHSANTTNVAIIVLTKGMTNVKNVSPRDYAARLSSAMAILGYRVSHIHILNGNKDDEEWIEEVNEKLPGALSLASKNAFPRGDTLKDMDYDRNILLQARLMMLLIRIKIFKHLHTFFSPDRTSILARRKQESNIGEWKVLDKYVMFRQEDIRFSLVDSNIMVIYVRKLFGTNEGPLNDIKTWVVDLSKKTFARHFGRSEKEMPLEILGTIGYGIGEGHISEIIKKEYKLEDVHSASQKMFPGFREAVNTGVGQSDDKVSDQFTVSVVWDNDLSERDYSLPLEAKDMGFTLHGFVEYAEMTHEELIFKPIEIHPFGKKDEEDEEDEEDEGDSGPPYYELSKDSDFFDWGQDCHVQPKYEKTGDFASFCTIHLKPKITQRGEQTLERHANADIERILYIKSRVEGIPYTPYSTDFRDEPEFTKLGVRVSYMDSEKISEWEKIPIAQQADAFKRTKI